MGKRQKVSHVVIVRFAKAHPEMLQCKIGTHFGLTQSRISHILRTAGHRRHKHGRSVVRKSNESELQHEWEKILSKAGLGMDRGLRINNKRIMYGEDPLKEEARDESVTCPTF
jgi:hypothetical protein